MLLHVEGATAYEQEFPSASLFNFVPKRIEVQRRGAFFAIVGFVEEMYVPQRLQRTCDLLWRFPKLAVPLAVEVD